MINKLYVSALSIIFIISCSDSVNVPDSVELKTLDDSVSYSLGADLGNTFKIREIEYEKEAFNKGFLETISKDSSYAYGASVAANFILRDIRISPKILLNALLAYESEDSLILTNKDIGLTLKKFDDQMRDKVEKQRAEAMEKAMVVGDSFIDKYKEEHSDEIETESGLLYRILRKGFGDIPTLEDKVIVHYSGKLVDGTIFDSSINKGEPATFRVNGVIMGWQEALTMMPVGSKWELVIPSILGYGEKSQGNIPGMSTLIFEVELLGIE